MPQIIQPVKTQIVTKEGECTVNIAIELTINLNADGNLQVSASSVAKEVKKVEEAEEKNLWAIPEFGGGSKVQFGKIEKSE